jgi:hypothetical protein
MAVCHQKESCSYTNIHLQNVFTTMHGGFNQVLITFTGGGGGMTAIILVKLNWTPVDFCCTMKRCRWQKSLYHAEFHRIRSTKIVAINSVK